MKKKYNPKVMSAKWVGLPHATGDGINMAKKINAKLVNMDHLVVFPGTIFDFQGTPTEISTRLQFPPKHFTKSIWINSKGSKEVVKIGWSWPAFFFNWIWCYYKKIKIYKLAFKLLFSFHENSINFFYILFFLYFSLFHGY